MRTILTLILTLALAMTACEPPAGEDARKPQVVATTTMIGDLAEVIGGERVTVVRLLEPGGDPHLYQPVPSDSQDVARSQLVLKNGLKLEGWIDELLENAGGEADIVTVTVGIEPLDDPNYEGNPDPHVWFDVEHWIVAAENVRDALIELDPEGEDGYRERASAYIEELEALDAWVHEQVSTLPEARRRLVTSHDAFQYFGHAYGFDVMAIQGISTEAEASMNEMKAVIDYVEAHHVPAIFIETSVNPALIEQVEADTGAVIGGRLYSDSLGAADSDAASYVGMIRHNVTTLVKALSRVEAAAQ